MKTAEKNANSVQGATAKNHEATNKIQNRPSLTGKEAKEDGKATDQTPAETPQVEAGKTTEAKAGSPATVDNEHTNAEQQPAKPEVKEEPKAEATKAEEPKAEAQPIKFALNLEQTLKSVNDLHRLSIQRLALIARIKTLEDFEVKLIEESDELESNHFHGCKLIIEDDKRRQFVTNTPTLSAWLRNSFLMPAMKNWRTLKQISFPRMLKTSYAPGISPGAFLMVSQKQQSYVRAIYRTDQPNILGRLRRAISKRKPCKVSVRVKRFYEHLPIIKLWKTKSFYW